MGSLGVLESVPGILEREFTYLVDYDQSNLLCVLAHELRAPITALITASELLQTNCLEQDSEQVTVMAAVIYRGAEWMRQLVENLLCAASIESGQFQVRAKSVGLLDLILDSSRVVEPLLVRKAQQVRVSADPDLPCIAADPIRIRQAIINLLSNANKYGEAETTIHVRLSRGPGVVRVSIVSRGPTLPRSSIDCLFRPFTRTGEALRSAEEGSGLGLTIVKAIVDAHGGSVGVDSRCGYGTSFWFELPVSDEAPTLEYRLGS
jgi:signal transduction histidine kinase